MSIRKESHSGKGTMGYVVTLIAIAMGLFHLYTAQWGLYPAVVQRGIHLLFGLTLVFLIRPARRKVENPSPWWRIADVAFLAASAAALVYIVMEYREVVMRGGAANTADLILGSLLLIATLEATRRVLGLALPLIAAIAIAYALFGHLIPGDWGHRGVYLDELISYQFLTTEGLFSIPLGASANFIFIFILFGAFLVSSGTGEFFIEFANSLAGHKKGGPAKVAILASATFGTISGSAVANVVSTGSFTIPLMKKIGYRPTMAGAIESVASSGGQFMPPVMGAAAFIMADMLGEPYLRVCLAALIPSVLFFYAVLYMVHLEALKQGLHGIPKAELPHVWTVLKKGGHLLVPAPFLIALLVMGYSPMKAGFWAIMAVIVVSWCKAYSRMGFKKTVDAMEKGAKGSLEVITACATAGIVIGVVTQTGIGLKFSGLVIQAAGGMLLPALFFIMITSLILGMGLTTSAAYILTVILGGPVLTDLGVEPLAAHMFVFYYACLSTITPPVALAAFAGSAIAGAPPFRTGFESMRLAFIAYLVPFLFVYHPVLIWSGGLLKIAIAFVTAILGCTAIGSALIGYFWGRVHWIFRGTLFLSAWFLIKPGITTDIVGVAMLAGLSAFQWFRSRRSADAVARVEPVTR